MTPRVRGRRRLRLASAFGAFWLALNGPAAAQALADAAISVEEYVARLDAWSAAAGTVDGGPTAALAELVATAPRELRVDGGGQSFVVDTEPVVRDAAAWMGESSPEAYASLTARLSARRSEAAGYLRPPADEEPARAALADILRTGEFRGVRGPTWWARLRQRINAAVFRWLAAILGSSAVPALSRLLVYALVGLALIVAAAWCVRLLRRQAPVARVAPDRPPASAKSWTAWLSEAQAAASEGAWRDAVHQAYWAAVSFLESSGAWTADTARTPREYLRLVPSTSGQRAPLGRLTQRFERVWYGREPADAAAFGEVMTLLKQIGCPSV